MQINANSKINDIANNNPEYEGWTEVVEKNHSLLNWPVGQRKRGVPLNVIHMKFFKRTVSCIKPSTSAGLG